MDCVCRRTWRGECVCVWEREKDWTSGKNLVTNRALENHNSTFTDDSTPSPRYLIFIKIFIFNSWLENLSILINKKTTWFRQEKTCLPTCRVFEKGRKTLKRSRISWSSIKVSPLNAFPVCWMNCDGTEEDREGWSFIDKGLFRKQSI